MAHQISDLVFAFKEKITDGEYKEVMDALGELNKKKEELYYVKVLEPHFEKKTCDCGCDSDETISMFFHRKKLLVSMNSFTYDWMKKYGTWGTMDKTTPLLCEWLFCNDEVVDFNQVAVVSIEKYVEK